MTIKAAAALAGLVGLATSAPAFAQDLGPQFMKFADGIYAYVGKNFKYTNTGIILTQDGVIVIDTGQSPPSRARSWRPSRS